MSNYNYILIAFLAILLLLGCQSKPAASAELANTLEIEPQAREEEASQLDEEADSEEPSAWWQLKREMTFEHEPPFVAFLTEDDLLPYEIEANAKVVVDEADIPAPVE